MIGLASVLAAATGAGAPPLVVVDRDDVKITTSCTVRVRAAPIPDVNGDGVVHVAADDVHVRFEEGTVLRGAGPGTAPDALTGTGIRITGRRVTLEGARVCGYRTAIRATGADGLSIRDCDVSGNFRQRLHSTPEAEAVEDWLRPHANDGHEWIERYGAGIAIENARAVSVQGVRVRRGQNGIVLDRVTDARIVDNDCSFLSGWGLALWRSSRNLISRNALDFCVRGYSHGVYNRGQDSAGILLFEQCSENLIVENSVTHGGDGLFAFAGAEALGQSGRHDEPLWYRGRGNNRNRIAGNDFSDAAAHGLELTFSFDNQIVGNRFAGNAICGIWGGYSQRTIIAGNTFLANGEAGYGRERGGINIEHGSANRIFDNTFRANACGVFLWWDEDAQILALPWAKANERGSRDNRVVANRFFADRIAVQLRRSPGSILHENRHEGVPVFLDADEASAPLAPAPPARAAGAGDRPPPVPAAVGATVPVGAQARLAGREHIVMTPWGPYDWNEPRLVFDGPGVDEQGRPCLDYRLLGAASWRATARPSATAIGWRARHGPGVAAAMDLDATTAGVLGRLRLTALAPGVEPVVVEYGRPGAPRQVERRLLVWADWTIRHFASPRDPRRDLEAWRAGAAGATPVHRPRLVERFGNGGPGGGLPADHFGTIATTTLTVPAGRWRVHSRSDDGIRVWLDGELVIDDWTWHPPRENVYAFTAPAPRELAIRVEHFELDGYAILTLALEVDPAAP